MNHEQFALLSCRLCKNFKRNSDLQALLTNACSRFLNWVSFVKRTFNKEDIDFYIKRMEEFKYPVPVAPDCFNKKRVKREVRL